jgi:TRAP-type transport system periplasmic protein
VHTRAVRVMIDALLKGADGQVTVGFENDITERGRKATELLNLVKSGDLDLCYFSSSYLTRHVPALGVFDIPFQFTGRVGTRLNLEGQLGALLGGRSRGPHRIRDPGLLGKWSAKHLERHTADPLARGLRRIKDSNAAKRGVSQHVSCARHGARDDRRGRHGTAIASGTVDAQENPLSNIELFGLQKYHPFVTMTGHFQGIVLLLCNAKCLTGWTEQVRETLRAAVCESTLAQWRLASDEEIAARSALKARGIEIIDFDDDGRAPFKQAVRAVIKQGYADLPEAVLLVVRSSPA